jgi:hypothetical protein
MGYKENKIFYVVSQKNNVVSEAKGVVDFIVQKLNLQPLINLLKQIIAFILENISGYPAVVMCKKIVDEFLKKMQLFEKFGIV